MATTQTPPTQRQLDHLVAELLRHEQAKGSKADITDKALYFRAKKILRR